MALLACTSSEVTSSSHDSRSPGAPTIVANPSDSLTAVRQRFARATASTSMAFAKRYGGSSQSRRTPICTLPGWSWTELVVGPATVEWELDEAVDAFVRTYVE